LDEGTAAGDCEPSVSVELAHPGSELEGANRRNQGGTQHRWIILIQEGPGKRC